MKTFLATCLLASFLVVVGCYDPQAQDSKIVQEVEAAGAGNLSTFNYQGLALWLADRPALTRKVYAECVPISRTAAANWNTTAEGTVCHAAATVLPPPNLTADTRAW
jgi:hypothetical protein